MAVTLGMGMGMGMGVGVGRGVAIGIGIGIGGTVSSCVVIGLCTRGAGVVVRLRDHGVDSGAEPSARRSGIVVDVAANACTAPSLSYISADAMAAFNSSTARDA
ncbi:hypothetical protein ACFYXQ_05475 [Nocardia jiangxiensis]|uniref:Uncharacterized protein n=1 Tax=Nocardia jiangxiensis TaxID=282685 RepID=A0ABW6RW78_9NOCA